MRGHALVAVFRQYGNAADHHGLAETLAGSASNDLRSKDGDVEVLEQAGHIVHGQAAAFQHAAHGWRVRGHGRPDPQVLDHLEPLFFTSPRDGDTMEARTWLCRHPAARVARRPCGLAGNITRFSGVVLLGK
ncbi:hypothetical protein D3C72_2027840 [compost metagenome]